MKEEEGRILQLVPNFPRLFSSQPSPCTGPSSIIRKEDSMLVNWRGSCVTCQGEKMAGFFLNEGQARCVTTL